MEIGSIILSETIKNILGILKDSISKKYGQSQEDIQMNIENHLKEVCQWSERLEFYGMSKAKDIDESTISLSLFSEPRKFRATDKPGHKQSESSMLEGKRHYVLLGDPGSGKTTTMKRLARRVLLEPPVSEIDLCQYPIVIRLKEIKGGLSLHQIVANILGLSYRNVVKKKPARLLGQYEEYTAVYIGNTPITIVIPDFLNKTRALLLLDGLDELSIEKRDIFEYEISGLSYKLDDSKIVVSCRSGDFLRHLEGFDVVEICPLDEEQIRNMARKWVENPEQFLAYLRTLPYQDIADRPLLLTQLLFHYKRTGYLPEQPSIVYKKVTNLLLEDWDAQRTIIRKSKYAGFDPERKSEFLASLSYHITYKTKKKVFSEEDLIEAYIAIHQTFKLPKKEARQVANEIETHTGIIIDSGSNHYEFSHLSLQEYLCAHYLVREPFAENLGEYLREYPAPLAIAVVLSSNPGNWFAGLILNRKNFSLLTSKTVTAFLSRLLLENPFFTPTISLGLAMLKLFFQFDEKKEMEMFSHLYRLLDKNEVKESIARALDWYIIDPQKGTLEKYYLSPRYLYLNYLNQETPTGGLFQKKTLLELREGYSIKLITMDEKGLLKYLED